MAGDFAAAQSTCEQLEPLFKKRSLATIDIINTKNGNFDYTRTIADSMETSNCKSTVLAEIAEAQSACGQQSVALATLRDAHEVAEGISDEGERAEAMRYLVFAGCKVMEKGAADWQWVTTIASRMMNDSSRPSLFARCYALTYIGRSQANAGDIAGAKQTLATYHNDAYCSEIARAIAKALCRRQGPEKAWEWIETLRQPGNPASSLVNQVYGYIGVADALLPDDDLFPDPTFVDHT